jgi:hypothetical protein
MARARLDTLVSMKRETQTQPRRVVGVVLKRRVRRMASAAQRLQFVVAFAQMDLEGFRPGDWLNLREDLGLCLAGPWAGLDLGRDPLPLAGDGNDIMVRATVPPFPDTYPAEHVQHLQAETYTILNDMVLATRESRTTTLPSIPLQVAITIPSLDDLTAASGQHLLIVEGATRDVFLYLVMFLVQRGGGKYILRCPECQTIFYRNRNQEYCSRPCVNRVSQRLWRERHDAAVPDA